MLVAANITMQFGAKPLFENVSVKFGEGYRYGLIGANGSGKSTFMKIVAGELEASAGNISKDAHERMAYLRQDQFAYEDQRVLDVVMMGHEQMWACMQEKDAIYANPEASEEDYLHAAELEHHFAEYGGYTAEARAGELLLGVGIPSEQHNGPMSEVAPGWKLRVLLTQALFADPDILLLDEPTNNLDIATIRWLENVLNERNSTMIIISHDRHFLNQVCTHMADLDFGKITVYPGTYDDFMEASSQARQQQKNANDRAKERIAELQEFVRRFSANKSKAKQATSRMKLIDKLKPEDIKPSSRQYPWIRFEYDEKEKLHRQAFEIESLSFGYAGGPKLFNNFDFSLNAGDRLAVIGENGVGKSTFLKLLVGALTPQHGEIRWTEKARYGYYAQDHADDFKSEVSLTDWVADFARANAADGEDLETLIRGTLGRLLFSGDDVKKSVNVISGGEQGRMIFGKLMLQKPNVLIMDEPTNHLDMESIESLNTALEKFKGTLIFVSHDREFVSSLATRILEIRSDGSLVNYLGTYEEYLASQGIDLKGGVMGKTMASLVLRLFGWKAVLTPPPGPHSVIMFYPHTSNWDFPLGVLFKARYGMEIHWAAKDTLFRFPLRRVLLWLGGVPINRRERTGMIGQLLERFAASPSFHLCIAPEGTRSKTDHLKTGFYRLAREAGVPLGLAFADYRTKQVGIGRWVMLSGDEEADLAVLREFYADKIAFDPAKAGEIGFRRD